MPCYDSRNKENVRKDNFNTTSQKTDVTRYYFRLKRHEKEFNRYVEKLGITTDGEKFVLYNILSRDWNRTLIILDIETIKFSGGLVYVKCRTTNGSHDFSVSHLGGDGWASDIVTKYDQESSIHYDLSHKLRTW